MPRAPKHFKIHCSIQNHRRTLGLFDDDALLAMYVRAGILAVERYADRTGDSFLLSPRDLERVAGCRGVANARRKLGRLEANSRLTLGQEGAGWRLTFPNFAIKQGFAARNGVEKGDSSTTTTTTTTTTTKNKKPSPSERGADAPPAFSEGDDGAWLAPQLRLNAKATAAERACWLEARFPEIAAAARIDAETHGGSPRDHGVKIASARWNAYLRERDPTKRDASREAAYREKRAALEASKAAEAEAARASPPPDDDPLADLLPFRTTREVSA